MQLRSKLPTWNAETLCGGVEERSSPAIEVQTIVEKTEMKLFPNPTQDILNIRLINFDFEQNYQIELYDMRGKLVLKRVLDDQQSVLSIANLAEGVYFCSLRVNGVKGTTQKVILLK